MTERRQLLLWMIGVALLWSCRDNRGFYVMGESDSQVVKVDPDNITIEGLIWYANASNKSGKHIGHDIILYVNDDSITNVNMGYKFTTTFGPYKKFEVPYIAFLNTRHFFKDVRVRNLLLNRKYNDTLRLRGKGVGLVIWDGSDQIDSFPFVFEKTIEIYPDLPLGEYAPDSQGGN